MQDPIRFEVDYAVEDMPVEKDAKIFEAGEYPDKEIAIGEDDLDAIVSNFTEVPVKVEHTDSPLDPLGKVKRVWRQGKDLFARLAFPDDLAAFLERRGVKKLSVALYKDPLRLAEVSLVLSPRVPTAAMFGKETVVSRQLSVVSKSSPHPCPLPQAGEGEILNPKSVPLSDGIPSVGGKNQNPQFGEGVSASMSDVDRDKEIAELKFALRAKDVEARLAELKAVGKIVPASESFAREILLQCDGKVTFGEEESTVAQLFERFLEAQPKVITFGELTPGISGGAKGLLSAEEEELLGKLGVTREQVEKYTG